MSAIVIPFQRRNLRTGASSPAPVASRPAPRRDDVRRQTRDDLKALADRVQVLALTNPDAARGGLDWLDRFLRSNGV